MQCHKAWDWRTELEVKGQIHNPHFFEWQQRQNNGRVPRNPLDVQCGGLPNSWSRRRGWDMETDRIFHRILRVALHVRGVRINERVPVAASTLESRVSYLEGTIDEKAWGARLFKNHQILVRKREFFHIHQMFDAAITDIVQRTSNAIPTWNAQIQQALLLEYENLRRYYNGELFRYCRRFEGRGKDLFEYIGEDWNLVSSRDALFAERVRAEIDHGQRAQP